MARGRAFLTLLLAIGLLPVALGWLGYTHRSVSVSCQRASGKVNCSETERVADQNVWTQPVWTAHAEDVNLTTRETDDESNPGAVVLRTQNDTQEVKFTSGLLGTNEGKVQDELHQFLVVRSRDAALQLDLSPGSSWRDWAVSGGLVAVALIFLLYSLVRVMAPAAGKPS